MCALLLFQRGALCVHYYYFQRGELLTCTHRRMVPCVASLGNKESVIVFSFSVVVCCISPFDEEKKTNKKNKTTKKSKRGDEEVNH